MRYLAIDPLREGGDLQDARGLRAVLPAQVPAYVRLHAPARWRRRSDSATVARALGLGDDQLLPEGDQREAEGGAGEGGRDVRRDHDKADAPEPRSDDPISQQGPLFEPALPRAGYSFAICKTFRRAFNS
jgi:hypothetical protein